MNAILITTVGEVIEVMAIDHAVGGKQRYVDNH